MTEAEKLTDWLRFVSLSQSSYRLNALSAVYECDGLSMLRQVLERLGLERTEDVILANSKDGIKL